MIKVIRGKRVFKIEILDVFILMFGAAMILSSIFSAGGTGSTNAALISIALLLGYFLLAPEVHFSENWSPELRQS